MKMTTLIASIAIATLANTANAHDNHKHKFVAKDDSIATDICVKAVSGKKFKFAQLLRHYNINKRFVADKLKCNEIGLPKFVATYNENADRILNLLPLERTHITIKDIARVDLEMEK